MTVLVQQGKGVQIERVALGPGGKIFYRPTVQARQRFAGTAAALDKETRQGRLTGDRFNPEHLGHGWIMRQMRHPSQFVRAAKNAANKAQRGITGIVGVGTGGLMR